ncbi:CsbD family protein [Gloeobacter kilaueensis]|uniref:Signal transduction histidine kinase LytS n=1 Tax=Gloeobacter kilaueensis (strain ATCC BAA-2537 / CCAP 1431/1 / ULC 316 / JS1) TaxID=1183438 RepID=U5QL97_GLOK1|nr:CsbD family protein [Gloeobacter kilaueensis]AGY58354.1 hypothetical protein GKIL_2108 [Gloeobacter kilaueensis JS1]
MADTTIRRAIGTFPNRAQAEQALTRLRDSGFDMNDVSVISRHEDGGDIAGADVRDTVGNRAGEGAATGATAGAAVGGLTGLLVGIGALAIPGIGPVMTAGALGTAIATTLSGGAIGAAAGGLVGALVGLGIPKERAEAYNAAVARGDYLVVVEGDQTEINEAESILNGYGISDYGVYDAPVGSYDAARFRNRPSLGERARNLGERVQGSTQENWGKVTNDPGDIAAGRAKQSDADLRDRNY